MKKPFLIFFLLSCGVVFSQSKKLWLQTADDFFFKKKDYSSALAYYLKILDDSTIMETLVLPYEAQLVNLPMEGVKDTTIKNVPGSPGRMASRKDYLIHQIAHCYKLTYNYKAAISWLKNSAYRSAFIEDKFYYGEALMHEKNYKDAAESLDEFLTRDKSTNDSLVKLAQHDIDGCKMALGGKYFHKQIRVRLCDTASINKGTTSFAPVYWGSTSKIIFTSARKGGVLTNPEKQQSEFLCDLYWSEKRDSGWSKVHTFGRPVNTGLHDGAGVMDAGEVMYFTRWSDLNRNEANIYMARGIQGHFYEAQKLGDLVNVPGFKAQQPFVTFDGSAMFWSSNRPGGKGGMDIWYCNLDEKGLPIAPVKNLSEQVNTPGDEVTPFYHVASSTLFYSSNGHPGFGGLDIMKSWLNPDDSTFALPVNLGRPINSEKDDAYMILDRSQQTGYFSSDREECEGGHCYDIYEFDNEPIEFDLKGIVTDYDSQEPIPNALVTMKNVHEDDEPAVFLTDEKGRYSAPVKNGAEYFIKVQKQKYLANATSISSVGYTESFHFIKDFELTKIPSNEIAIDKIEYAADQASLLPESKVNLDKVYDFLLLNDNVNIQIEVYTDVKGSDKVNQALSESRANECVNYLVAKGIKASRLIAKGYGKSKPLYSEAQIKAKPSKEERDALRMKNQRTAFKVIGEGVIKSSENQ